LAASAAGVIFFLSKKVPEGLATRKAPSIIYAYAVTLLAFAVWARREALFWFESFHLMCPIPWTANDETDAISICIY
jgi:hypothetical protein